MKSIKKRILFLAPLPPPIDGQSKASLEALHALQKAGWFVEVVNTNRKKLERTIATELIRIFDFFAKRRSVCIHISVRIESGELKRFVNVSPIVRKTRPHSDTHAWREWNESNIKESWCYFLVK
jgi:hypothetical protein